MFKKVTNDAILPTRGSKYSACVDVYANEDVVIGAGETKLVGLGIAIDLDNLLENVPMVKDIRRWHKERLDAGISSVLDVKKINYFKDEFLKSHYLQLMLRNSLAAKSLMLGNGVGVINLDDKDEIKMIIHNPLKQSSIMYQDEECEEIGSRVITTLNINHHDDFKIKKGDRIGQLTLLEHKSYLFGIESEDERIGGFVSTGK